MRSHDVSRRERAFAYALVALSLLAFYSLNRLTPVMRDDWSYTFDFLTKRRIASFGDIFRSLGIHYTRVNGRLPVHFLAHLFLWCGKAAFNVVNTLAFAALAALVARHGLGSARPLRPGVWLAAFFGFWMLTPAFGESFLWVTGAANYLYGMLIILLYLLPFRRFMDAPTCKKRLWYAPLALLGGVLAGWTNENTGGALVLILLCFLARRLMAKQGVPLWFYAGLLGCAAGLALMVLAPGELTRLNGAGGTGGVGAIFRRALLVTQELARFLWPLFAAWALLLASFLRQKREAARLFYPIVFLLAGLAAAYAMAFAPQMPARVWSGPTAYLLISLLALWHACGEPCPKRAWLRVGSITLCAALALAVYARSAPLLAVTSAAFDAREAEAAEQLARGERDLHLPAVCGSGSRFDAAEVPRDITSDPAHWVNAALARYLGADAVVEKER